MKKTLCIAVILCIIIVSGCSVREQPETVYAESEQRLMQDFFIAKTENKQLKEDIRFEYDSASRTYSYVTQRLIQGLDSMRPTFFADGDAYVGEEEQLTGITACDFRRRNVVYTVRNTRELTQQTCTVSIVSPQTTGLPILRIDIAGNKEVENRETYLPATYVLNATDTTILGTLEIRGRGNSTWWPSKKPYKIKLTEPQQMFDMHKARTWVLLANALDPTLLTNDVGLEIARRMELPHTNHTQHIELYVNGSYRGNYLLTEQIDIHKGRVEADTLSGGWLIEIDSNYDKDLKFKTSGYQLPIMMRKPENTQAMEEVRQYFAELEKQLQKSQPDYNKLSQLVDMPSLARYLLFNDLVSNGELGHPKSVFCFRRNNAAPLEWGPAWDFDWAFGYVGSKYVYFHNAERLTFDLSQRPVQAAGTGGKFFSRFFLMPEFVELYRSEWQRVAPALQDIDEYAWRQGMMLDLSWLENQKRWQTPDISKRYYYMGMMAYLDKRIDVMTKNIAQ